jgi:hypothetical protein
MCNLNVISESLIVDHFQLSRVMSLGAQNGTEFELKLHIY